jgi:hypothetical protein
MRPGVPIKQTNKQTNVALHFTDPQFEKNSRNTNRFPASRLARRDSQCDEVYRSCRPCQLIGNLLIGNLLIGNLISGPSSNCTRANAQVNGVAAGKMRLEPTKLGASAGLHDGGLIKNKRPAGAPGVFGPNRYLLQDDN